MQEAFDHDTSQTLPTGIDRFEGDNSSTTSGNHDGTVNAGIAIIDTGIQPDHPDLDVRGGYNCTSSNRSA